MANSNANRQLDDARLAKYVTVNILTECGTSPLRPVADSSEHVSCQIWLIHVDQRFTIPVQHPCPKYCTVIGRAFILMHHSALGPTSTDVRSTLWSLIRVASATELLASLI